MHTYRTNRKTLVQNSFGSQKNGIGTKVINGVGLTIFGIFFRTLITIGSMSILARLLTPADFGHIAMATVVTELAALFSNFGFGSILIQKQRISRLQLDTVYWISLALGLILSSAVFIFSYLSVHIFSDPVAGELLRVLSITFFLEEMIVVHNALLSRQLMYRKLLLVQIFMLTFRAGSAVVLAMYGWGVWSLIGGVLIGNFMQCFAYSYIIKFWPRFKFNINFIRETWRTNGSYFGGGFIYYVNSNIDLLIIGRNFGAISLGYYQNSRSLTDEIRSRIATPLQRVLFPAFSALKGDIKRFQSGVLRSSRLLGLAVMPIAFGIAAIAEEIVAILYGKQWYEMIPILKILSIASGLRAATSTGSPIFNATNQVGLALKINTIATVLTIGSIFIGIKWGLVGVSYALAGSAFFNIVIFKVALGLIGFKTLDLLKIILPPILAATGMFSIIFCARLFIPMNDYSVAVKFILYIAIGIISYFSLILLIGKDHRNDVIEIFNRLTKKAGGFSS